MKQPVFHVLLPNKPENLSKLHIMTYVSVNRVATCLVWRKLCTVLFTCPYGAKTTCPPLSWYIAQHRADFHPKLLCAVQSKGPSAQWKISYVIWQNIWKNLGLVNKTKDSPIWALKKSYLQIFWWYIIEFDVSPVESISLYTMFGLFSQEDRIPRKERKALTLFDVG